MSKTIKAEGKTYIVPDDATDEEINEIVGPAPAPAPKPLGEQPLSWGGLTRTIGRQALEGGKGAAKGAFELLGSPGAAHPAAFPGGYEQKEPLPFARALSRPPSNTAQEIGSYIPTALSLAVPARAAMERIPNLERAGQKFETVMQAARRVPLDLAKASEPAIEAHNLSEAGATMPKIMNRFLQRTTSPGSEPLTYEQGRRFASNAGRLSTQESLSSNPMMQRQVSALARALGDANEKAAEQAGVGALYRDAMTEYRHGMALRGAKDTAVALAKSTAAKYVLGGLGLGAGYGAYHKLTGE